MINRLTKKKNALVFCSLFCADLSLKQNKRSIQIQKMIFKTRSIYWYTINNN